MTELFPSIQPEIEESTVEQLPMAKEVAWDFTSGIPIYSGGRPVIVTEAEAVKVWCWRALKTARFRHDIYTWDYGCEVESLVGRPAHIHRQWRCGQDRSLEDTDSAGLCRISSCFPHRRVNSIIGVQVSSSLVVSESDTMPDYFVGTLPAVFLSIRLRKSSVTCV